MTIELCLTLKVDFGSAALTRLRPGGMLLYLNNQTYLAIKYFFDKK